MARACTAASRTARENSSAGTRHGTERGYRRMRLGNGKRREADAAESGGMRAIAILPGSSTPGLSTGEPTPRHSCSPPSRRSCSADTSIPSKPPGHSRTSPSSTGDRMSTRSLRTQPARASALFWISTSCPRWVIIRSARSSRRRSRQLWRSGRRHSRRAQRAGAPSGPPDPRRGGCGRNRQLERCEIQSSARTFGTAQT